MLEKLWVKRQCWTLVLHHLCHLQVSQHLNLHGWNHGMTALWDHRTVWAGRDLKEPPSPTPATGWGLWGNTEPPSFSPPQGCPLPGATAPARPCYGGKRRDAARRRGGPAPPGRCVSRRARADWLAGGERRRPAGRCGGLRTNGGGGRVGGYGDVVSSSALLLLIVACSSCSGPSSQGLERVLGRVTARGGRSQGLLVSLEALPRSVAEKPGWF